ncbi:2-octaprenyl-3-methyl-6-methoxy-1,4-benzoquinol hydroxylase [Georgfuchsia toluolica]|uniref:2-octaprenyl-3-methyl-6-methoxy-1,4-benzoquinol hydroxylase n=1 Tax=Georgfuchsia toluolica TaxID=424218 RepID=A0A916J6W7_9PROT|nr:UbiH/UbiF family hydroxylase [Georgfuchsia toluolica]CAG4885093.1 2-octaprenyl-3-methyl-6-methoxy-1,4-benzoquinol hydroxylase [Georgfuchsia toluolica]
MKVDVLIVGGGLAGLSLAVALRKTRLSVALLEGRAPVRPAGWDSRIYAVSPANAAFLASIGVWPHIDPARLTAVDAMEIHGDAGGRIDFSAYDAGADALAWIVESSVMQCELWESAKRQANLALLCPVQPEALAFDGNAARLTLSDGQNIEAQLVVAADGAGSWTRATAGIEVNSHSYGQLGVVANFRCEKPHRGTAFQWFRNDGVLAWLPLPDNMISMVWSTPEANAVELLALDDNAVCARVAEAGQHRLGALSLLTPAIGFPLRLMRAPSSIAARLALIGDAAHTIHPLSGHGINLGFQDARVLAKLLTDKPDYIDCGDHALLRRYERTRKEEVIALQATTHGLHKLFTPAWRPLSVLRNAGLSATNSLPLIKDVLVRYAIAS